jgi:hypothetical protein
VIGLRNHDAAKARPGRRHGHRQDPRGGDQLASEGQLAGEGELPRPVAGNLRARHQDAERQGEIEPRPVLSDAGGRKIDHDAPERPFEPGALHRGANALAGVLNRHPREPRDGQRGQAPADVGLDPDDVTLHPHHRYRQHPPVHAIDGSQDHRHDPESQWALWDQNASSNTCTLGRPAVLTLTLATSNRT